MNKKKSQEVIILMGFPCSGKSTLVKEYQKQGYARLNRDDMGCSLEVVHDTLDHTLSKLKDKKDFGVVLDNTYPSAESRKAVIDIAKKHGVKVICVHLNTSIEDSQMNSCLRILGLDKKYLKMDPYDTFDGKRLSSLGNMDAIPAIALFTYRKRFEEPSLDEGFDDIQVIDFVRKPFKGKQKALLLDFDDTLRKTKDNAKYPLSPANIEILEGRTEVLKRYKSDGYLLLGISNQSGIGKGLLSHNDARACFDYTIKGLGVEFDEYQYCPHGSFPIQCYCRKPMGGIGVYYICKYGLNPDECIVVGDMTSDKTFSKRCGMQFIHADKFFV